MAILNTGIFILMLSHLSHIAFAETKSSPSKEMNGYSLSQFGDFTRNWHLVTTRYRKDSGEMRFTYANDLAWKSLKENVSSYPDGSVFAKVSLMTQPDPAFESSAVPSGARRIQFMVRDQRQHATTDGWGYALFNSEGDIFPGEVQAQSMACAACHKIVPQRGYVFSQIMSLHELIAKPQKKNALEVGLQFSNRRVESLPAKLRELVKSKAPDAQIVRTVKGDITKHVFFGTLDEIRPTLAREFLKKKIPSVFLSEKEDQFSIVFNGLESKSCAGEKNAVALLSFHTLPDQQKSLYETSFCFDRGL